MRAIDRHAWNNRWRDWHPAEKGLPALGLLLVTLTLPPLTTSPLVLGAITLATVWGARVSWAALLGVLAAPLLFLTLGLPFLALSVAFTPGFTVQLSADGFQLALTTALRSLAAMSCLAFLILTTPLSDGVALLRRVGMPAGVIELMLLMYRLIFVFAERALNGGQAQTARLGYSRLDRSVRSLGLLAGNLFQRALQQARRLEIGLAARGYEGALRVLTPPQHLSWLRLAVGLGGVGLIGAAGSLLARAGL